MNFSAFLLDQWLQQNVSAEFKRDDAARQDRLPVPRSSEYPAFRRGHWGMGRPPGHADTAAKSGEPALVRV